MTDSAIRYGEYRAAEWAVQLEGHRFDLEDLALLLRGHDPTVVASGDCFYLVGSDLDSLPDASEVHRAAHEIICLANGLAPLYIPEFEPVSLAAVVREQTEDGQVRKSIVCAVGNSRVRLRGRAIAVVIGSDGKEKPDPGIGQLVPAFRLSMLDEPVRRMASFLDRGNLTWLDLYRVLDVMKEDLGHRFKDWCDSDKVHAFKGTANNYSVIGRAARHGRLQKPPKETMTFEEARNFMLGLARRWLDEKLAAETESGE